MQSRFTAVIDPHTCQLYGVDVDEYIAALKATETFRLAEFRLSTEHTGDYRATAAITSLRQMTSSAHAGIAVDPVELHRCANELFRALNLRANNAKPVP